MRQVNKEELLFLETDSEAREKAIFEEKMKSRGQMQRLWASVYWSDLRPGQPRAKLSAEAQRPAAREPPRSQEHRLAPSALSEGPLQAVVGEVL